MGGYIRGVVGEIALKRAAIACWLERRAARRLCLCAGIDMWDCAASYAGLMRVIPRAHVCI